jgi:hypothetical protein
MRHAKLLIGSRSKRWRDRFANCDQRRVKSLLLRADPESDGKMAFSSPSAKAYESF